MEKFFWLFPVAILAYFAYRFIRFRSLMGALLGGRIVEDIGEIDLASPPLTSYRLKVHIIQSSTDALPEVAMAIVAKAPMGASLSPIRLSKSQAMELAALLERAGR